MLLRLPEEYVSKSGDHDAYIACSHYLSCTKYSVRKQDTVICTKPSWSHSSNDSSLKDIACISNMTETTEVWNVSTYIDSIHTSKVKLSACYTPWRRLGVLFLFVLNLATRWGCVVSITPWPCFTLEKGSSVPTGEAAWWEPEPVWTQRSQEKSSARYCGWNFGADCSQPQNWLSYCGFSLHTSAAWIWNKFIHWTFRWRHL